SINNKSTYWTFLPYNNIIPSTLVIAGTSNGMDILQEEHDELVSKGNVAGFDASAPLVVIDNNKTIWAANPYRGIFKIDIRDASHPTTKVYNDKKGLPSSFSNQIFKIKNKVVASTIKGLFEYNAATDSFETSNYFKDIFGG